MRHSIFILFLLFLLNGISCNQQAKRIATLKYNHTGKKIETSVGECKVAKDVIDPVLAVRKTDLEAVQIFSFTHPKLKKFFRESPFMLCHGGISLVDEKQYLLNVTYTINSKNVNINYNGLAEESMLRINLINGEKVFLHNILSDPGKTDHKNRKIYRGLYPIESRYLKLLSKYEIDQFGVIWNGGYEAYDVHDIDFMIRQIACLRSLN